ncbi:hypothetical protein [Flammeovirga sp. SubArs3]|uniref:hypothetical protein n=1 Tax=Flammeovirga sp. SubArs3 TaxID=2995316 RepID=UPI00248B6639|nr:hypothetical protein [Flammeovirga sp. SubArs3]
MLFKKQLSLLSKSVIIYSVFNLILFACQKNVETSTCVDGMDEYIVSVDDIKLTVGQLQLDENKEYAFTVNEDANAVEIALNFSSVLSEVNVFNYTHSYFNSAIASPGPRFINEQQIEDIIISSTDGNDLTNEFVVQSDYNPERVNIAESLVSEYTHFYLEGDHERYFYFIPNEGVSLEGVKFSIELSDGTFYKFDI